jgi:enamine deaminase RidA (YjgF/YER057c/UK114 family)
MVGTTKAGTTKAGTTKAGTTKAGTTKAGTTKAGTTKAGTTNLRFINPPTIAKPPGYTHVIETTAPGRTVFIAGQLGLMLDGKLAGGDGDFRTQARQAFENLKNALAAVGAGFAHVVKLNNYLIDIRAHLPIYREIRDAYVNTANPPASTTVEVRNLAIPGAVYEVEAIAVLPELLV